MVMDDKQKAAWSVRLTKRTADYNETLSAYYTIVAKSDALMRAKLNELAGSDYTIESVTKLVGVVVEADGEEN
jgi:hypothetical protein